MSSLPLPSPSSFLVLFIATTMEFLDEEARPRFLFQSRVTSVQSPENESEKLNKPVTFICVVIAVLFSTLSILYIESETLRSLVLWFSLSLLVGPFAPTSLTGGDPRVGQGEPIQPPPSPLPSDHHLDLNQNSQIDESKKSRRPKSRKPVDESQPLISSNPTVVVPDQKEKKKKVDSVSNVEVLEEMEWTEEDFHLLKKQISRHPVGEPRRWELITEAFKGRHGMESVIKTAKSLGEKKPGSGGDSYSQFLKQRKPLAKRANGEMDEEEVAAMTGEKQSSGNWSSAEDIALLNALKVFPKEVSMRWEKIAAAVPGKSKALCMKRVAELKKDFRSSKASDE